jgi:hypothetical protein
MWARARILLPLSESSMTVLQIKPNTIYMSRIDIEQAFVKGAQDYFEGCRARIPDFVRDHYRYPGAWHTNRIAFGWDLVKAPLNLFWAPVYVSLVILGVLLSLLGLRRFGAMLRHIPGGIETKVQSHVATRLRAEVFIFDDVDHPRSLQQCIARHLESQSLELDGSHTRVVALVDDALKQLKITRTASADITNTLFSTGIGALFFKQFTPGGIGIGFLLAAYIAQQQAIASFIFGDALGRWYYSIFPVQAGMDLKLMGVAIVLVIFSVFASFSGLISDPLQAHCRLHQRRLRKILAHLEQDLIHRKGSAYRPKDAYLARLFELGDAIKTLI